MSIQTELTRLTNAKAAIQAAIEGKGVTVPDGTLLDGMAALIDAIEAGGGGYEVSTGIITPSEAVSSISWEHGLSKAPNFVMVFIPTGYSFTTYANHARMYYKKYGYASSINEKIQPYVSKSSTENLVCINTTTATDTPFIIDSTTVTAGECKYGASGTVRTWVAGRPYHWICAAGDIIFPYE